MQLIKNDFTLSRLSVGRGEGKTSFHSLSHTRQTICFATLLLGIKVVWPETELGGPNIETKLCLGTLPAKASPHTLPCLKRIGGSSCDKGLAWIMYAKIGLYSFILCIYIYIYRRVLALLGWMLRIVHDHCMILIGPNVAGPTRHIGV